jgi:hypothetical protein
VNRIGACLPGAVRSRDPLALAGVDPAFPDAELERCPRDSRMEHHRVFCIRGADAHFTGRIDP